jgi:hypothetical protein
MEGLLRGCKSIHRGWRQLRSSLGKATPGVQLMALLGQRIGRGLVGLGGRVPINRSGGLHTSSRETLVVDMIHRIAQVKILSLL